MNAGARAEDKTILCLCNELDKKATDWRLYLYAKDPLTWKVIKEGPWAELKINRPSGKFTLAAQGLLAETEYALVRTDGRAQAGQVLTRTFTDGRGNFNVSGVWHEWSAKFWVVLGNDLQGKQRDYKAGMRDTMKGWHPKQYIFESEEIL